MPKRICWKKGMRLSEELFRNADRCTSQYIGQTLLLAAAGRFGLIPSPRPFKLVAAVNNNQLEVETLDCTGITRSGAMIDAHWDSQFTQTFNIRVPVPDNEQQRDYMLIITVDDTLWREVDATYCEPNYELRLILPDSPLPENALPLAMLVKDYAWTVDTHGFIPPCMLLSAHPHYIKQCEQALELLHSADHAAAQKVDEQTPLAIILCWPILQQQAIKIDKLHDQLSPMELWAILQQCINTVFTASLIDSSLVLDNPDKWQAAATTPYSVRNVATRINEALALIASIPTAMQQISVAKPEPPKPEPPKPKLEKPQKKGKWWEGFEI